MGRLSRRSFLRNSLQACTSLASLPLLGSAFSCERIPSHTRSFRHIPGEFVSPESANRGHLLRDRLEPSEFPQSEMDEWDVVVLGGGISGLSAMWKLKKAGAERVLLLELEGELGGTSSWSESAGQSFPWGAHYINVPPAEADCIHELLLDLDIIVGYDAASRPQVNPDHLLKWPRERLHMDGRWLEGFDPVSSGSHVDREMHMSFEDDMLRWMLYSGRDGRKAFSLPLAYSSADSVVRELDDISMFDYVRSRGWDSTRLDWSVNYACRDDYGSMMHQVSAWAGIHYFACRAYDRRLSPEYPTDTLTWQEGNGYLVKGLMGGLRSPEVRMNTAVLGIDSTESGSQSLACLDLASARRYRLSARNVIFAGKLHTAPYVIGDLDEVHKRAFSTLEYSPWLVAAIHVNGLPGGEVPLAWDNVAFSSSSLGYINASHQRPGARSAEPAGPGAGEVGGSESGVLVYYYPFVESVKSARRELLSASHGHWVDLIMNDLVSVHPNFEQLVERIDIRRWGHAMVRPSPGLLWGTQSVARRMPHGSISFASCDVSGLPLFEEAAFNGIRAAEECLRRMDVKFETSIPGMSRVEI